MRRVTIDQVKADPEALCNEVQQHGTIYGVVLRYQAEPTVIVAPVAVQDPNGEEWLDPVGPVILDPTADQPFDDQGEF